MEIYAEHAIEVPTFACLTMTPDGAWGEVSLSSFPSEWRDLLRLLIRADANSNVSIEDRWLIHDEAAGDDADAPILRLHLAGVDIAAIGQEKVESLFVRGVERQLSLTS